MNFLRLTSFFFLRPETYRYLRGSWPTDSSFFRLYSTYQYLQDLERNLTGHMEMEIPLATRHTANIEYGLNEKSFVDNGYLKINYNDKQVLNSLYKGVTQLEPVYMNTIDITVENEMKPLGIHFVNRRDRKKPEDSKHIEIFELKNARKFNLTGEFYTIYNEKGDEYKIVMIHPNRTVILTTNYEEEFSKKIKHCSKLELSQTAWIGYSFEMNNYTVVSIKLSPLVKPTKICVIKFVLLFSPAMIPANSLLICLIPSVIYLLKVGIIIPIASSFPILSSNGAAQHLLTRLSKL